MRVGNLVRAPRDLHEGGQLPQPCGTGDGLMEGPHLLERFRAAYINETHEMYTIVILIRTPWATIPIRPAKKSSHCFVSVPRFGTRVRYGILVRSVPGALM